MEKNLLAIDLGKGSIGLAISRSGNFISLLPEVRFKLGHYDDALKAIKDLLEIETIEHFVVGYPLYPSGDECEMTPIVKGFAAMLRNTFPNIAIHYQDERNSTVEAMNMFHENGIKAKKQKRKIDSGAAYIILERYLKRIGQN